MPLRERVAQACGDAAALAALLDCETSLAGIDAQGNYRVQLSTVPARVGQVLSLEGFEPPVQGRVRQYLHHPQDGRARVRTFIVDTLESDWQADLATPSSDEAQQWFATEQETLARYLEVLS